MDKQAELRDTLKELLERTQRNLAEWKRLRHCLALSGKNLLEVLNRSRTYRAVHISSTRQRAKARAIRFPLGEFNLDDLDHVNPGLDRELLRSKLAEAIESGRVQYFYVDQRFYRGILHIAYRSKMGGRVNGVSRKLREG